MPWSPDADDTFKLIIFRSRVKDSAHEISGPDIKQRCSLLEDLDFYYYIFKLFSRMSRVFKLLVFVGIFAMIGIFDKKLRR